MNEILELFKKFAPIILTLLNFIIMIIAFDFFKISAPIIAAAVSFIGVMITLMFTTYNNQKNYDFRSEERV